MKYLIKIKLLLLITVLAISCGKKEGVTSGKISVISGLSALATKYPGGVALLARNLNTGAIKSKKLTSNDLVVEFPNGKYEILIMAWDGSSQMTGTAFCANKDDVVFDGNDITLNFSLQSGSCGIISSKSGPLFFHSNVMGGDVPAISGDYSVKLILYEFEGMAVVDPKNPPQNILGTSCLVKDSADACLKLSNASSFPALDIPIMAEVYDGKNNCSGLPTRKYLLPTGLDEDNTPYRVNSINIPLDDLIFTVNVTSGASFGFPFAYDGSTFNATIDWGDGNSSSANDAAPAGAANTYAATGEYIVRVSGLVENFSCNASADCNYITHVLNFGDLGYQNLSNAFKSSANLSSFSGGKTGNVSIMNHMFFGTPLLSSLDLSSFNTSAVTDMSHMFGYAAGLNFIYLQNFNTSSVINMNSMFENASVLTALDLTSFDTSKVTNMNIMFGNTSALASINLSSFNTSAVTDMGHMFQNASALTSIDLSSFNTSNVTNMTSMFSLSPSLTSLDLSNFNTSAVTDMSSMFYSATGLTSLDLSNFDTSSVTTMRYMFKGTNNLTTLDISNFNTSAVNDMNGMFYYANALTAIDLSSFDTSSVIDMTLMFYFASSLTALDLSNFDTSSATGMGSMFQDTTSLTSLNTTNWDISAVSTSTNIFLNKNVSLNLTCNDQDNTTNGSGTASTGTMFGEACI